MRRRYRHPLLWTSLWLVLLLTTLYCRPLLPVDETRYVGVAWEMWQHNNLLVPYLNGEPYSHKPPLLFWLMQLSWSVFGVHAWAARLVSPLFGLGSLFLTYLVARQLWPNDTRTATLAPLVVLGSLAWSVFSTTVMFDMLMAFFSLLGVMGILWSWRQGGSRGWIILGLASGLGVLAKGPVILLYTLPVAIAAPWWMDTPRRWKSWYLGILFSVAIGALIGLSWALPAAWQGGEDYRNAILWGQTTGRLTESFAHRQPWWWYLPWLPALLFPWFIWPPVWRGLARIALDAGLGLCLAWSLAGLLAFSLISGKQFHYLLPLFPAIALVATRSLADTTPKRFDDWLPAAAIILAGCLFAVAPVLASFYDLPAWVGEISPLWGLVLALCAVSLGLSRLSTVDKALPKLALASLLSVILINVGIVREARNHYDVTPISRYLAALQAQNIAVAHIGEYYGQFQFSGRLTKPIEILENDEAQHWAELHPEGCLVSYAETLDDPQIAKAEFHQPYRSRYLIILKSETLLALTKETENQPALLSTPETLEHFHVW